MKILLKWHGLCSSPSSNRDSNVLGKISASREKQPVYTTLVTAELRIRTGIYIQRGLKFCYSQKVY